ncbi:hypothetical protein EV693_1208, partial [Nicoletella semolina]
MQKSVFSLKKSVVALAVLSVSGVGVAQDASSSLVPSHLSVSQVGTTLESGKYGEAINNQVLDNLKTELELLTLNSLSKIAYNGVHANGIYRGASQQKLFEFFYKGTVSDLPNGVKVMEKIRNGNIFDTKELAEKTIEILKQRDSSSRALNLMEGFAKGLNIDTKDGALIASLANQFIINQKLQELTVGSHKQLKLDIGRLDDVVKGQGEEIDILQFGLEDAILSVEGNSNQIAEVSYDLADLQSEVEYTTSTMREDIAEAHEAIVLLDRADEIQ